MPADAEASEVVELTFAEPIAAAAALGLAPLDSLDVGSESEVPDSHNGGMLLCALLHGSLRTCAGPHRSEHQRQRSASKCECDATRTRATLVCLAEYSGIDRC